MVDLQSIEGNEPIMLNDQKLGICIRFGPEIGVQVPGEEQIRWLAIAKINRKNGMLFEVLKKPQYTELRQEVVTSINRDGSYNTVDATTFDGKIW